MCVVSDVYIYIYIAGKFPLKMVFFSDKWTLQCKQKKAAVDCLAGPQAEDRRAAETFGAVLEVSWFYDFVGRFVNTFLICNPIFGEYIYGRYFCTSLYIYIYIYIFFRFVKPSRWWQLNYSNNFQPDCWGFMIQFDEHIFQMGWFNHQLDMFEFFLGVFNPTPKINACHPKREHFRKDNSIPTQHVSGVNWLLVSGRLCWLGLRIGPG